MDRQVAIILFLGLFVTGLGLTVWSIWRNRIKGSALDVQNFIALTALSFVFDGAGIAFSALQSSTPAIGPGGKPLPPDFFATIPPAVFFAAGLLVAIGLLLGSAFKLVSSWRSPAAPARRREAGRLAIYGAAAFAVALAHHAMMRFGADLLK